MGVSVIVLDMISRMYLKASSPSKSKMASVPYSDTATYQISAHLVKIFLFLQKNKMCFAIIGYNFNSEKQFFVPYWLHIMTPKTIQFLPYVISIRCKKREILSMNRVIALFTIKLVILGTDFPD